MKQEPQTFQFKTIRDILTEIYYRLRGQRVNIETQFDAQGRVIGQVVERKDTTDPLTTEWGANRLLSFVYPIANEQTPFANLTSDVIVSIFGKNFAKALNADMYRNFEKYFNVDEKGDTVAGPVTLKSITNYSTTLKIMSLLPIQIMSRAVGGNENQNFYNGQRIGITGQIPTAGTIVR